jgi:hypothetical protein
MPELASYHPGGVGFKNDSSTKGNAKGVIENGPLRQSFAPFGRVGAI